MHQRRTAFCHPFILSSEGVKPVKIHLWMKVQYGDVCLSLQQVYRCTGKSTNGMSSATDSPRPGQAHPVVKPEGSAAVEAIVKENCRVTVNEIAAHLDMSHGSSHHIVQWNHCVPFVFNKLWDKKYLRFSFDSPAYFTNFDRYVTNLSKSLCAIIHIQCS